MPLWARSFRSSSVARVPCSTCVHPARLAARTASLYACTSVRSPSFFASSQAAFNCSCESNMPGRRTLPAAKILITSAPASFCFLTKARISSTEPVFSPWPIRTWPDVRIRGPGSSPFAMASRNWMSARSPTLCTVVKPAMSVDHAFAAACNVAYALVPPPPAFLPSLSKLHVMWTCASIHPGITVRPRRS